MPDALVVRGVTAGYGSSRVLRDVDLTVRSGAITCLLGANGAGKTTLVRVVSGLITPVAGGVTVDGASLLGTPPWHRVRAGLGTSLQENIVFPGVSVRQNLLLAGRSLQRRARNERAAELLDLFPALAGRVDVRAGALSGGEQRMLSVAMALTPRPTVLMLDEPSIGLSPVMVETIFDRLRHVRDATGTSILLAEQNAMAALAISEEAYVLRSGSVVAHRPAAELRTSEQVMALL
ncbi:ABC transporter ATP-binding protein [Acrocarpospora catenulata]|uniref:ABC transporter ATP-binding protein n=1 Tax=Acrocarpospora catenulata TaxID=2836182 RepID=UPI001BD95EDF|nr:ABC transporter ATP-binding protein [Acrocarpospora catenulata]